jgi:hypothetical protein
MTDMEFGDLFYNINEMVRNFLDGKPEIDAETVGLDRRCGSIIVGDDFIAKRKSGDNSLQYYGGFEYVSKEFRNEIGDWVFYVAEDSDWCRVSEVIERYQELEAA